MVEESDYLPFGTENVITDTITNNYKFIAMESFGFSQDRLNFEGTAALDHTLYRQSARTMRIAPMVGASPPRDDHRETSALPPRSGPNLARWTTPDSVHGSPDNPQSWNRYPYVLNDPLTLTDPLGTSTDDTTFVGCYWDPWYEGDFGCGWHEDASCPPGFIEIHGDSRGRIAGGGIETINSLYDYATYVLPGGPGYGELYGYELTPNSVRVNFPGIGRSIELAARV